jgi:hypothetical protein
MVVLRPTYSDRVDEIRHGKRTVIERGGHQFELPREHTIEVYEGGDGPESYVSLGVPEGGSSLFVIDTLDECDDGVIVRIGELRGVTAPGAWGAGLSGPFGYPFPEDAGMD